jgi:haloalkane dehalogenase
MNNAHQRRFSVNTSEYPFESHWFERRGSVIHYLDEGEGVPVLLLHGNPTWSFLYRNIIRQLQGTCRLIAPDYPGFGLSGHPSGYSYMPQEHGEWVNALIDHLSLSRFIMVVQDWGGPIGLSIAVSRPDDIAGLVICNTWAWKTDTRLMRTFSKIFGSRLGKYLILQHNLFVRQLAPFKRELKVSKNFEAYIAPFAIPESRMGTYVFPWAIGNSDEWLESIESKMSRLAGKPVELVWGMQDMAFGNETTIHRWLRYFPAAPVDRIPDAGHYIQEDHPDRVVSAIKRVLMAENVEVPD